MKWDQEKIDQALDRIFQIVLGTTEGEITPEKSFTGDLMADSLDYLDMELHISQIFGISFDFGKAVEEMRAAGIETVRVRNLRDYLAGRIGDD